MKKQVVGVVALTALGLAAVGDMVPELTFRVAFDGSAVAERGGVRISPARAERLAFVPGLHGEALHVGPGDRSVLAYAAKGNFNAVEGTIAFWFRPDTPSTTAPLPNRRTYVQTDYRNPRLGTGAVMLWTVDGNVRGDLSDDADRFATASSSLVLDRWNHIALSWNERQLRVYVNGIESMARKRDAESLLATAFGKSKGKCPGTGAFSFSRRREPSFFSVGSQFGGQPMCGAMDDLCLWDRCLDAQAIVDLRNRERAPDVVPPPAEPDYARVFSKRTNSFERAEADVAGQPGELELISEWKVPVALPQKSDVFNSVGTCRVGELNGARYLEAGSRANDRFVLRLRLDPKAAIHCLEIDYPDDRLRTADLIVQTCRGCLPEAEGSSDYGLQVGYATGDEYANTGKVLTHRCLYWTRSEDVALVAMTARQGAPAAVSAVRVYRVKSGALPVAKVREPPPNADGWRRTFALYYEDPAIYGDFARVGDRVETAHEIIDRVAALMKYTGQNILCYPAVWYQGEIGTDYLPRPHPPRYREAYYEAFDREGLGLVPTLNPNEIEVPEGLITSESVRDGSLHDSPVNMLATGLPNPGGWHSTPPNCNVTHPDLQRQVFDWFDRLIAEGRRHPSFRGLCLHLTRHSVLWFGDRTGGFNDYTVEAFARDCGLEIPPSIGRTDPLRGRGYADWITNGCEQAWVDWRCRQVAKFWKVLAKKLADARPDLKLMINTFLVVRPVDAEYGREDTLALGNRNAGFDPELLRDVPNLIVCQSVLPADYRWFERTQYGKGDVEAKRRFQRDYYLRATDYDLLKGFDYPWVNQHDRYWESATGDRYRSKVTLDCPWLREMPWRVTTINPAGREALRQYAVPLRYGDVLGLSKGGFLVGTYGSEDVLVPWIRAFRSLPAVVMSDLWQKDGVIARHADFKGMSYFYLVNTRGCAQTVNCTFPAGSQDLVSGQILSGDQSLKLKAYELRAYQAPSGRLGQSAIESASCRGLSPP